MERNKKMSQQDSTSLSDSELADLVTRTETGLMNRPNDLRPISKLLQLLDFQSPNTNGDGPYSRCQRTLESQFRTTNLTYGEIIGGQMIELLNNWRKTKSQFEINKNTPITQVFEGELIKINKKNADCSTYLNFFKENKAIVGTCFDCYKVQIIPDNLVHLIKIYFIMKKIYFKRDNTRKCMIELRENVSYPYKGYIYCQSEEEAISCRAEFISELDKFGLSNVRCGISHGCSEYGLEYPEFKYSADGAHLNFDQPDKWKEIEEKLLPPMPTGGATVFHQNNYEVTLRDIYCFETWIKYAELIGDSSYRHFDGIPISNKADAFVRRVKGQAAARKTQLAELQEKRLG